MSKHLGSLSINEIELSVHLGWTKEERKKKQTVLLNIGISFHKPPKACVSDELNDTICYFTLIEEIQRYVVKKEFRLIEHLSYELFQLIKPNLPKKSQVTVRITKRPKIKDFSGSTQFCYGDAQ